jgi:hypothetical protein
MRMIHELVDEPLLDGRQNFGLGPHVRQNMFYKHAAHSESFVAAMF